VSPGSWTVAGCEKDAEGREEEATLSALGGRTASEDGDACVEERCGVVGGCEVSFFFFNFYESEEMENKMKGLHDV
jgi:hypothetical protein